MNSTEIWIVIVISSALMFLMRLLGFFIPPKYLQIPRLNKITSLIPIVLLAALVAVQSSTLDGQIVIDHRLAGLAVGAIILYFKGSFILVLFASGLTGALIYNFL